MVLLFRLYYGPELVAELYQRLGVRVPGSNCGTSSREAGSECVHRTIQPPIAPKCSSAYVFESLEQVRESPRNGYKSYNEERPHDALAACRRPYRTILKPEVLLWQCRP